jgi:hypothetical protein
MKGCSTCCPPIQTKSKKLITLNQKKSFIIGRKAELRVRDVSNNGRAKRIKIAENIATTPPNLFGIDLKIA